MDLKDWGLSFRKQKMRNRRRSHPAHPAMSVWLAAGLLAAVALLTGRRRVEDLAGQTVLITGGSRGLGLLLAREFGQAGCRVAICARDIGELALAQQALESQGVDVLALRCDVSQREEVDALVQEVTAYYGQIDILVNNAGIIQVGPYRNLKVSDFKQAQDVMFWGSLYTTMAVTPQMIERRRGRIVNITSIGGRVSVPHLLPYNCAKFAAVGLSEGLGAELARYGIGVTTVVPGLMRTGSHIQAQFKGQPVKEFASFSLLGSLPFFSMDAERAAHQIVAATKRGVAECTLTAPAVLLARFHGLWPGATVRLLGLANRLLPGPGAVRSKGVRGEVVQKEIQPGQRRLFKLLTTLSQCAAQRYQQLGRSQAKIIGG
jgi:NAD(P)-dependent dehydrogenase (short-subunit alcohol dehydrogenase family)